MKKVTKLKGPIPIKDALVMGAALLIVILGVRYIAADLLAPLLVAFFLTAILRPFFGFFRNKGLSRGLSMFLMVATVVAACVGTFLLVTWSVDLLRQSLSQYTAGLRESLEQMGLGSDFTGFDFQITFGLLLGILGNLSYLVLYFFIVPLLAVLLLLQLDSMPKETLSNIVNNSGVAERMGRVAGAMVKYVGGRLKVNIICASLYVVSFLIFGVDFAFLWGFLSVILGFVPYIGFILSGFFPTMMAFSQYGPVVALMVLGSILLIAFFGENVIDPKVQGARNKISTASMVVALVFWTWLLGPVGAILSAPLTFLIKLVLADYPETRWVSQFMEGDYSESNKNMKKSKLGARLKSLIPFKKKN